MTHGRSAPTSALNRRDFIKLSGAGITGAFVLGIMGSGEALAQTESPVRGEFEAAAGKSGVPVDLLLAIGYVNTRWEMPPPGASPYRQGDLHGKGTYGLMQLVRNPGRDTLGKAAEITGRPVEELKGDVEANVFGGAAVLSRMQGAQKPDDPEAWFDAVAEYGGGTLFAQEVFGVLRDGASGDAVGGGSMELAPREGVEEPTLRSMAETKAAGDYKGSTWYGNNGKNCSSASRGAAQINRIVIHVAQGSYSGTLDWFRHASNDSASAHYTVSARGGYVGQSVREDDIAWHAGWWDTNKESIGIEHAGYVGDPSYFKDEMYRPSARLTAYLCKKYGIPIDRQHIWSHAQVPGCSGGGGGLGCHTDPGRHWNWDRYISLVRGYAGTSGTTYSQTVDNATPGRFTASSRWVKSEYHQDASYGSSQRVLKTPLDFGDNAKFKIKTPAQDTYTVYARWPADPGYNWRTTFFIRGVNGWHSKVVNQRQNGGQWVNLGNYVLAAGDSNKIQVSSKSSGAGFIVADAVMIVRR